MQFTCLYKLAYHQLLPQLHVCRRPDTKLLKTLHSHKKEVSHIRFLCNNPYKSYIIIPFVCIYLCTYIRLLCGNAIMNPLKLPWKVKGVARKVFAPVATLV